jgi:polysaccharide export outer membrane protein
MLRRKTAKRAALLGLALIVCAVNASCLPFRHEERNAFFDVPREQAKVALPTYVIEPPDVLLIDAVRLVPLPPHKLEPLDAVLVQFPADPGALAVGDLDALTKTGRALSGVIPVEPEGTINLGAAFGAVNVVDLTVEEARAAVEKRLRQFVKKEIVDAGKVTLDLAQIRGLQQIRGEHLVRPDGTIGLGSYGSVYVTGMSLEQAKAQIETHLSKYLLKPSVSIDVAGFNSKVYYVIFDGGGFGEQVIRLPVTGNETVLDAIGQVYGLPPVASRRRIWIARPSAGDDGCDQILPVDWKAITRLGSSAKNYQVLPGDRIYVDSRPLIAADSFLGRVISPVERILGVTLLTSSTITTVNQIRNSGGGGNAIITPVGGR